MKKTSAENGVQGVSVHLNAGKSSVRRNCLKIKQARSRSTDQDIGILENRRVNPVGEQVIGRDIGQGSGGAAEIDDQLAVHICGDSVRPYLDSAHTVLIRFRYERVFTRGGPDHGQDQAGIYFLSVLHHHREIAENGILIRDNI